MGGVLLLLGFLVCGVVVMDGLLPRRDRLIRLWLGLCAGLILMMWLPVLFAFFIRFTLAAQLLGLGVAVAIAGAVGFLTRKTPRERRWTDVPPWLLVALLVPFLALCGWLEHTHTLRDVDGALHVGQSTFGDLCMHMSIITSLRNSAFPPDYCLLPGSLLGYPFLGDGMVTSMVLCGGGLRFSYLLTAMLMLALVGLGFIIFSWELTHSRAATVLAFVLMFVNGGLGFMYAFDGIGRDATAFHQIFTGFYKTPTNQPDLNLRWVNFIVDMLIPQRTLLSGFTLLLPALWMLITAIREQNRHMFVTLGVWAGAMPMVHTHSFLALGMISAGAMAGALLRGSSGERGKIFSRFALYGAIAVALAVPQILTWTLPQTTGGGALRFYFNWVNNQGNGRLIDGYCWFWIKNVGLIWLLMIPAALSAKKGDVMRMLALGALLLYIVAELVLFQRLEYDNNKLFYAAYMVMMPAMGLYLVGLWNHLKGVKGRALIAAVFLLTATVSGALSIAREVVSDYQLFSFNEAEAARYIDENTPQDALFLTGQQHNNAVAVLAGRDIVCGPANFLFTHGLDYTTQRDDARRMLEQPAEYLDLLDDYGVDYVYLSTQERANFALDEAWYAENAELVYTSGDVNVYRRPGDQWK